MNGRGTNFLVVRLRSPDKFASGAGTCLHFSVLEQKRRRLANKLQTEYRHRQILHMVRRAVSNYVIPGRFSFTGFYIEVRRKLAHNTDTYLQDDDVVRSYRYTVSECDHFHWLVVVRNKLVRI
jgi:hypothetical protein